MSNRDNGLPPKEAALFKSIVKHYETKQYKKGLKAADQVLKKFPEHGETNAMKGLILNCQERKTEAYELVARGVKQDIKSHVCWHVYGLLYRSDREYLKAIKCYRGALRHDPDNSQILRDLSLLQVQMRDLAGFVQTRQHLLTLKPTNRNNWFTFAVSQHLSGAVKQAVGIVEAYERTLEGTPENDYEHSEMLLYKNMLLVENGQRQEALEHLEKHKDEIVDVLCWLETRGKLLRELGRFEESAAIFRQLLKRNPEHVGYHAGLQACVLQKEQPVEQWIETTVDAATEQTLKELYAELQHTYPRSTVCRRLPLDFARDADHFRVAAKTYLLPPIRKGVPSLFADIKPIYADAAKAAAFGDIFHDWLASLEGDCKLRGESFTEMPTTIMWVRVLLAQHLDMMGESIKALEQMEKAIEHTPTLPDLYMLQARIHKHAGSLRDAAEWTECSRQMDLQDRYLNTKSTRYLLRSDQVDEAQKVIGLFTKDGDNNSNLNDMQCMWYALELARSHLRQGEFGKALKSFTSIDKHFNDIVEDQFDFHTYCIRKMTLRAYIRMLRLEDGIFGHHFWVEAAHGAANTYIAIFDKPTNAATAEEAAAEDNMSAAERKKLESKRRKAEAKAKAEAEAAAKQAAAAKDEKNAGGKNKKGSGKEKPVDEDPDGVALASVDNPLEKASGFLRTLEANAPADLRTHILACELNMRKKKYLLVLRALRKAHAIAPDEPAVHKATVRFLHAVGKEPALDATISKVIEANREHIGAPTGTSLPKLVAAYIARAPSATGVGAAAAATLAGAEMTLLIEPSKRAEVLATVSKLDVQSMPLPLAYETHGMLLDVFKDEAAAKAFGTRALAKFNVCPYFGGTSPTRAPLLPAIEPTPPAA